MTNETNPDSKKAASIGAASINADSGGVVLTATWQVGGGSPENTTENSSSTRSIPEGRARLEDAVWMHAMYVDAHCSVGRIGSVVGVTDRVVKKSLRAVGIELRTPSGGGRRFPQLDDAEFLVRELAGTGQSLRDVSRSLGCSEQSVRDAVMREPAATLLKEAGWTMGWPQGKARPGRPPNELMPTDEQMVELVQELAGGGWVSMVELRDAAGLSNGQYRAVKRKLLELESAGRIETAMVQRERGFKPGLAARPARVAAATHGSAIASTPTEEGGVGG